MLLDKIQRKPSFWTASISSAKIVLLSNSNRLLNRLRLKNWPALISSAEFQYLRCKYIRSLPTNRIALKSSCASKHLKSLIKIHWYDTVQKLDVRRTCAQKASILRSSSVKLARHGYASGVKMSGMVQKFPAKMPWIYSWRDGPKKTKTMFHCAPCVARESKRTRAATIWPVFSAIMNFAGLAVQVQQLKKTISVLSMAVEWAWWKRTSSQVIIWRGLESQSAREMPGE